MHTRPNVLRAVVGQSDVSATESLSLDWDFDTVTVLETNLDDINAEHLGHFVETTLEAGALDVFYTSIQMKKNRPGVLLTVLCKEIDADKFSEKILCSVFIDANFNVTIAWLIRRLVKFRSRLGD